MINKTRRKKCRPLMFGVDVPCATGLSSGHAEYVYSPNCFRELGEHTEVE